MKRTAFYKRPLPLSIALAAAAACLFVIDKTASILVEVESHVAGLESAKGVQLRHLERAVGELEEEIGSE